MNFEPAVNSALNGDSEGIKFLYRVTYKEKYYLALKYLKEDSDAEPLIQEAYRRTFSQLDKLGNPNGFSNWLGVILANTAKNVLENRRQEFLFKEFDDDCPDIPMEEKFTEVGNIDIEYNPIQANFLTKNIVDVLDDGYRICVMMYYYEGQTLSSISLAMKRPKNVIKNILSSASQMMDRSISELRGKGHQLPISSSGEVAKYIMSCQEANMNIEIPEFEGGEAAVSSNRKVSKTKNKSDRKSTEPFLKTKAGKIALISGVVIASILAIFLIYKALSGGLEKANNSANSMSAFVGDGVYDMEGDYYPAKIAGGPSEDEFRFILAYGPAYLDDGTFKGKVSKGELKKIINNMCMGSILDEEMGYSRDLLIENSEEERAHFSISELNRCIGCFTEKKITSQNIGSYIPSKIVDSDDFACKPEKISHRAIAYIKDGKLNEKEMRIEYMLYEEYKEKEGDKEPGKYLSYRVAILKPGKDGLFRLERIVKEKYDETRDKKGTIRGKTLSDVYKNILDNINKKAPGYDFSDEAGETLTGENYYILKDIDEDGVPELIVSMKNEDGYYCKVFEAFKYDDGYILNMLKGGFSYGDDKYDDGHIRVLTPKEGKGILLQEVIGSTKDESIYRVKIVGSEIEKSDPEKQFKYDTPQEKEFSRENPTVKWIPASNTTEIDKL